MPQPESPTYEELVAQVAVLSELVAQQASVIESLQVEVAGLRRQVGRDSSNSSQPPSQDGPAVGAVGAVGVGRGRSGRSQGGQKGHRGTGLGRVAVPDDTHLVEPGECAGCGGDLRGAAGWVAASVQVFDIPPVALKVTEYQMMRRECGCGHVTTAAPPPGVSGGPTCYGPNVVAAATLLASADVIGIERAAQLMSALLGADVSTGFVSRCLVRLDEAVQAAGFEEALKEALKAAEVVGTDETPAPLTEAAIAGLGCSNPHVYTVRTMRGYTRCEGALSRDLVWYGAAGNRTKPSISSFGILDGYHGVLVRDDYGGYVSYDEYLAGVQQCLAHLARHLADVHAIDPADQVWTRQVDRSLKTAITAVRTARADGQASLDPALLARLRREYDQAVAVGISINLSRPWHKGRHPGLVLAQRLKKKTDQVWLFTTRFDVPATNNGSENAIRGYKLAAKVSGCWRTLITLRRHCRIRSYLTTAANHGHPPLKAIRDALAGNCWMPPAPA